MKRKMRSKKWRDKEFSTKTLTQIEVDEIISESEDYELGKAPVSRNTQTAEALQDLAELQKHSQRRHNLDHTYGYSIPGSSRLLNPEEFNTRPSPSQESQADEVPEAFEDIEKIEEIERTDGAEDCDASQDYVHKEILEEVDDEDASSFYRELDGDASLRFTRQPLRPEDEFYEDIMHNFTSTPTKPEYWFKEQGDHWYCSCGQLNKGENCSNCGLSREILRNLFLLHEPGEEVNRYGGKNISYTEVEGPQKKRISNKKLVAIIISIVVVLIAAGLCIYLFLLKPSIEEQAAKDAEAAADSIKANVVMCSEDVEDFLRESYVTSGNSFVKSGDFQDAIKYYNLAAEIQPSEELTEKVQKAKYEYVLANVSRGGDTFEKYLNELYKMGYKDTADIYAEFYAWNFTVIANIDPNDDVTDMSTVSRADTVYFHVFASGGPPDETVDVYYVATWPDGRKQTDTIGKGWKAGSKGYARFAYPVPFLAKEGTMTFKVFDSNTQELLGNDSVTFKK